MRKGNYLMSYVLEMKNNYINIKREKYVLKELKSNPFVVDLKYTFQDHKNLYIVNEFLNGGNLREHMANKLGFGNDDFLFYISEVIVALKSIHENNIIYRNLIPENIMIDERGHVKLIDFCLAKTFNNIHKERTYTV